MGQSSESLPAAPPVNQQISQLCQQISFGGTLKPSQMRLMSMRSGDTSTIKRRGSVENSGLMTISGEDIQHLRLNKWDIRNIHRSYCKYIGSGINDHFSYPSLPRTIISHTLASNDWVSWLEFLGLRSEDLRIEFYVIEIWWDYLLIAYLTEQCQILYLYLILRYIIWVQKSY